MNYYILVPWGETGGPEGLHQLCYELINLNKNANIVYYDPWADRIQSEYSDKICGSYKQYIGIKSFTPTNILQLDDPENVIVLPEIFRIKHIKMFKNAKIVYLRLSNNSKETALDPHNYDSLYDDVFKTCYTACDPALIYKKIVDSNFYDLDKVFMLTPGINNSYLQSEKNIPKNRTDTVLFNPSKGVEHTKKIVDFMNKFLDIETDIEFFPLTGMTQSELKEKTHTSKVYIDFGHLPGKDRLSREVASGGCVVLIGTRGSGADCDDFQIDDKIEWDEENNTFDYHKICLKIIDMIQNYNFYFKKQKSYRDIIRKERNAYVKQVKNMINIIEK